MPVPSGPVRSSFCCTPLCPKSSVMSVMKDTSRFKKKKKKRKKKKRFIEHKFKLSKEDLFSWCGKMFDKVSYWNDIAYFTMFLITHFLVCLSGRNFVIDFKLTSR